MMHGHQLRRAPRSRLAAAPQGQPRSLSEYLPSARSVLATVQVCRCAACWGHVGSPSLGFLWWFVCTQLWTYVTAVNKHQGVLLRQNPTARVQIPALTT